MDFERLLFLLECICNFMVSLVLSKYFDEMISTLRCLINRGTLINISFFFDINGYFEIPTFPPVFFDSPPVY